MRCRLGCVTRSSSLFKKRKSPSEDVAVWFHQGGAACRSCPRRSLCDGGAGWKRERRVPSPVCYGGAVIASKRIDTILHPRPEGALGFGTPRVDKRLEVARSIGHRRTWWTLAPFQHQTDGRVARGRSFLDISRAASPEWPLSRAIARSPGIPKTACGCDLALSEGPHP